METDVIKPYDGPLALRPEPSKNADPKAVVDYFSDSAVKFAASNPQFEQAIRKGGNRLDPETQANLDKYITRINTHPPKPATVVNLHPWPLTFGAINRFTRGIMVPECPPGQLMAWTHIRVPRRDWHYNENGSMDFDPIDPINIASEFVREFSNKDNDGGGVLIFEGDGNPEKYFREHQKVETYDPLGRPNNTTENVFQLDEENNRYPATVLKAITGDFYALVKEAIAVRNTIYHRKVQRADLDYRLPDGRGRSLITPKHFMMAEVLHSEGMLPIMPDWKMSSPIEQAEAAAGRNCPACGKPAGTGYMCVCGNILDAFKAYMDYKIDLKHAKMELLTSDEWEQVDEEEASRAAKKKELIATRKAMIDKRKAAEGAK